MRAYLGVRREAIAPRRLVSAALDQEAGAVFSKAYRAGAAFCRSHCHPACEGGVALTLATALQGATRDAASHFSTR